MQYEDLRKASWPLLHLLADNLTDMLKWTCSTKTLDMPVGGYFTSLADTLTYLLNWTCSMKTLGMYVGCYTTVVADNLTDLLSWTAV